MPTAMTSDSPVITRAEYDSLSPTKRKKFISSLTSDELMWLKYYFNFWARPDQIVPPGWGDDFMTILYLCGRGYGKTFTASGNCKNEILSGRHEFSIFVGDTPGDVTDVMVMNGASSIMRMCAPWERPVYSKTSKILTWPNGAITKMFSGSDPESIRGVNSSLCWIDELAKMRYSEAVMNQVYLCNRIGKPRLIITTTPTPTKTIFELEDDPDVRKVYGSTFDNSANLAASTLKTLKKRYDGSVFGAQELYGRVSRAIKGALWNMDTINKHRDRDMILIAPTEQSTPEQKKKFQGQLAQFARIVIAVDPAVTSNEGSDEHGIIVVGQKSDGHSYVLADESLSGTPDVWGKKVVTTNYIYYCDYTVVEVNNGGELVAYNVWAYDPNVQIKMVRATRGKYVRAEPISSLYTQGLIHHVGVFSELEKQMCEWVPGNSSPDRMDALVWALTYLYFDGSDAESSEDIVISEPPPPISYY